MPRTATQSDSKVSTPIRRSARIQNVKTTMYNSKSTSGKRTASTGKLKMKKGAATKSTRKDEKPQEPFQSKAAAQKRKHSDTEDVADFTPIPSKVPRRSSSRIQSAKKPKKELQVKDKKSPSESRKSVSTDKKSSRRSAAESAKSSQRSAKKPSAHKKTSRKSVKKTPAAVKRRAKTSIDVNTSKKADHAKSENSDFDSVECEIATADESEMRKDDEDGGNSVDEVEICVDTTDAKNDDSDVEMVTSDEKFEAGIMSPPHEEERVEEDNMQETAVTSPAITITVENIDVPEVAHDLKEEIVADVQTEPVEPISADICDMDKETEESASQNTEGEMQIPMLQNVSQRDGLPMVGEKDEEEAKADKLEMTLESGSGAADTSVIAAAIEEPNESSAAEEVVFEEPLTVNEVEKGMAQTVPEADNFSDPTSNVNGLFCSPHSGDGKVFGPEKPLKIVEQLPVRSNADGYFIYSPGMTYDNLIREKTVFVFCCNCMDKNSSDVLKLLEVEADMYFFQNLDADSHEAIINYVEQEKKLKRFSLLMDNLYYSLIFDSSRLKIISNRCLTSSQLIDKICDTLDDKDIVSIKEQITASSVSLLQIFSFSHAHTNIMINAGNLHIAASSEDICSLEVTMALKELLQGNEDQVVLTGDFKVKPNSFLNEIIRGDATIASFENIENPTYIDCERGHLKLTELFGDKILLKSPFIAAASEVDKLREPNEMDIWTHGNKLKPCALWKSTDFSSQWTLIGFSIESDQTE